jgi:hypothetical protein
MIFEVVGATPQRERESRRESKRRERESATVGRQSSARAHGIREAFSREGSSEKLSTKIDRATSVPQIDTLKP